MQARRILPSDGPRAGGNVIDFVALMENLSAYDAARRVDELFPAIANPVGGIPSSAIVAPPLIAIPAEGARTNVPLGFALKDIDHGHPMIRERSISVETARRFGIGFFAGKGTMTNRIVFPLKENGRLIGYAGRTTLQVSPDNPKWLIGKGIKKTFVYNLERCDPAKPLILVESLWGPPFFHEKGLQAAALMGLDLSSEQELSLDPFRVITHALDNDRFGIEQSVRIRTRLKVKHKVVNARLIE